MNGDSFLARTPGLAAKALAIPPGVSPPPAAFQRRAFEASLPRL